MDGAGLGAEGHGLALARAVAGGQQGLEGGAPLRKGREDLVAVELDALDRAAQRARARIRALQVAGAPYTFLVDGDEVVLRARTRSGLRLGEVRGTIVAALDPAGTHRGPLPVTTS